MRKMDSQKDNNNLSFYEKELEYAVGVLEMVNVLIKTDDEHLKGDNLLHLNKIIPRVIEELKAKP